MSTRSCDDLDCHDCVPTYFTANTMESSNRSIFYRDWHVTGRACAIISGWSHKMRMRIRALRSSWPMEVWSQNDLLTFARLESCLLACCSAAMSSGALSDDLAVQATNDDATSCKR